MKCYLIEDNGAVIRFFPKTFKLLNSIKETNHEFYWIDINGKISTRYPVKNTGYSSSEEFKNRIEALAEEDTCFFIDLALNKSEDEFVKGKDSLHLYSANTAVEIIKTLLQTGRNIKIIIISTIPNANIYWKKTLGDTFSDEDIGKLQFLNSFSFDPSNPRIEAINDAITKP